MNKQNIITTLIALFAFAACRPSAQKAAADAVESIDSTETVISTKAVPSVDTLPAISTTAASEEFPVKILAREKGSISFVVDEHITPIDEFFDYLYTGKSVAEFWLAEEKIPKDVQRIIATSFSKEKSFKLLGKDAFYRSIVEAYANHLSITLSPDMIWLVISQGFARYVNAHAEELRPKLVNHTGKKDLVIVTNRDLLAEDYNWPPLISRFASKINQHTKGNIAQTITSDFTTTGTAERVASQITLMESVKSYFEYIVDYIVCGIPSVTLTGTVKDWQKVLEKTRQLKQYGLEPWISELEPILMEFIRTADGHPKRAFWSSIVKKVGINKLEGGGCMGGEPTKLDGWILKLFPDEYGHTPDKVEYTKDMPTEYVRVGFKYRVIDPSDNHPISETAMELWAGFIGAQVDKKSHMVTPKIGWLVRISQDEKDMLNQLKKDNENGWIHLRVQEVPIMLSELGRIRSLHLVFTGRVMLPDWMDKLTINRLTIEGNMTEPEKAYIKERFPNVRLLDINRAGSSPSEVR